MWYNLAVRYREIISYPDMLQREKIALQKGMNFKVRGGHSVLLMSVRKGAPYHDQWHEDTKTLEYEGHDAMRGGGRGVGAGVDPKRVDQPLTLPSGRPTENGKFFAAAMKFKAGEAPAEIVQVYEKIADGIWCDRGRHELVDAELKEVVTDRRKGVTRTRKVCRFFLKPVAVERADEEVWELSISRQIPTPVKVEVWKRDQGKCVTCGATDNLHFDHDVPWSKGGSSITAANVKLLCARHNLKKSDKIICLGPLLGVGGGVAGGGGEGGVKAAPRLCLRILGRSPSILQNSTNVGSPCLV